MQPVSPPPPNPSPTDPGLLNPTDVVGRRIGAFLIDAVIGVVLILGYAAATFTNTVFPNAFTAELQCDAITEFSDDVCVQIDDTVYVGTSGDAGVITLIWLGWVLLSTIILPGITGWSPGKLITGVRIVKTDTLEKAGFGANVIRGLLWVVDAFPYVGPLVGGVTMLARSDHQRIGDLAAGTLVVRTASVGRPPVRVASPISAPPPGAFSPPPPVPGGPPPPSSPPTSASSPPPVGLPVASSPPPPPSAQPPPPTGAPAGAPPSAAPPSGAPSPYQPPPPAEYRSPASANPPVFPPPSAPPAFPPVADTPPPPAPTEPVPVDATPIAEPEIIAEPESVVPPAATAAPDPTPTGPPTDAPPRPGVDAPMWDDVRDTYIQWDPELTEWMEWSEPQGRWVPISR
ncbi:MAG: RDD family protein [Actinomycetota bacterium]